MLYLKTFQALSYERLEGAMKDLFGLTESQGGLTNMLDRRLDDLLARATTCDLSRAVQDRIRRARDQLLTFTLFPGQVEPTNNACERDLRPAVIQRKVTNGYRSTWSTERLNHGPGTFAALLHTVTA